VIELAIMIEGQDGLTWARWQRLAQAVEDLGFVGLYRSDHYTNANPPDLDSLEMWTSFTWLASHTRRIEFGPIVSPVSFRHPTMTARIAMGIDDLSGGRLNLGLGAGWQVREHEHYGLDLLGKRERMIRFEEGVTIISMLLDSDTPVSYDGQFYHLKDAVLLPRPMRKGGPPIVIGGNGPEKTLPLAARFAKEWNGVFLPPARYAELNGRLTEYIEQNGRNPADLRRSLMTGCLLARDDAEMQRRNGSKDYGTDPAALDARGIVYGTPAQMVQRLGEFADAGVQRIMLQWLDQDDITGLETLAKEVLPQVSQ